MPSAASDTINTVINSVLTKSRNKLLWAVQKANVLYAWASETRRVEFEDGGWEITNPMIVGRNPNVTSYTYYDQLPIEQTDEFATARYYWSRVAGSLMVSQQEIDENRGEAKLFDIVGKKTDVLIESITEKFSQYMYGAGVGTDPNGLALLIPDDPTTGTVGGISRANTYWRTSSYDFDGSLNATNIEQAFDDIMLDLTVKGSKPDIGILGRNLYRMYKQAVRDKFVILKDGNGTDKKVYDLGFEGIKHGGVSLVFDEDCDVDRGYFINSEFLRLHVMRHVNFRRQDLEAPWTQDVHGKRVVWQGQWCLWRAWRTHATVFNR